MENLPLTSLHLLNVHLAVSLYENGISFPGTFLVLNNFIATIIIMLLTFFACQRADTHRSVPTIDCSVENVLEKLGAL